MNRGRDPGHASKPALIPSLEAVRSVFESIPSDFRGISHRFMRNRVLGITAVLSLALGIGANTAVFGLLEAVMVRKLPVKNPEQLVLLHWTSRTAPSWTAGYTAYPSCNEEITSSGQSGCSFSYPAFQRFEKHLSDLSGLAAYAPPSQMLFSQNGTPAQVRAIVSPASGNFFGVMEVASVLGRVFADSDDQPGTENVCVLSYSFWMDQFGGSPAAIGSVIGLSVGSVTVVGVAPRGFSGVESTSSVDVWVPVHTFVHLLPNSQVTADGDFSWLYVFGRLRPDRSPERAGSELTSEFRQIEAESTSVQIASGELPGIRLADLSRGLTPLRRKLSESLGVLMAVVAAVLLVACANLSTLLLASGAARRSEFSVKLALGASRWRLVRQLLTECLAVCAIGSIAGVFLALWLSRALTSFLILGQTPGTVVSVSFNFTVLGFAIAATLGTALIAGIAPALQATNVEPSAALRASGGSAYSAFSASGTMFSPGRWLVIGETAIAVVLLIGAGLLLRTLANLEGQESGLRPDRILTIDMASKPSNTAPQVFRQIRDRLGHVPGVRSAAWSSNVPLGYGYGIITAVFNGRTDLGEQQVIYLGAGPGFFETMRIPVVQGRSMREEDASAGLDVVWVNQTLVHRFFENMDPIGKRLNSSMIVGVVEDTKIQHLRLQVLPTVYRPAAQGNYFVVRTEFAPAGLVGAIRQALREVVPGLRISTIQTLEQAVQRDLVSERLTTQLCVAMGALALALACVGVYGVLAYSVARRTGEFAVRMSLGAMRGDILLSVLREGLGPAIIGVGIGILSSYGVTKVIEKLLYGVKPLDPLTYGSAVILLLVVASLACYVPARRAMSVEPAVALRFE